ncbi:MULTISPECIES: hypothetical protein [Ralstonia solanacearum species complex]|uniref:Uncharacterized protein n=4 Tax=Ralstonia solanacearum TaxID=305 RepID=A0ABF7RAG7_RALSL|nr:hypothetical protein [Ralstonia solanacearum]ALF88902.1 hypothetical protein RSUY_25800 [Ralstonia solanacearum]ATI28320.1 hypothetical protein CCY86_12900 [Ralstonia solanacearum]EAP71429.1 Hypothetical Protein RRSL_01464 [Ralstonia solanacearum UW551]KEI31730.1 hypothetical protein CQ06_21020 [Ralstonia solanacearum]KFX27323.1 hypothetical protein KR96_18740 [Ralstonia solanacearum]
MSHTSGSIAHFEVDGLAYQARLFAMPFHVPENGRVRAHAIGRPDMPFSGVHVMARWLKARCLPPGVELVMADRLFSHGAISQWSGADGARAAKVLSQVALGAKAGHRLWRRTAAGGFRDETAFFLGAAFVQTDAALDDVRLLGDLVPASEWAAVAHAASTMMGLHLYRPDEPEMLVDCAVLAPAWTETAVERADGYRALTLLHSFTEGEEDIHVDIELLPPGQVVLQVESCSTRFSARFNPELLGRDMTDALLRDALALQHGDHSALH